MVTYQLYKCARELGVWKEVAVKPTGGAAGGSLVFVMPRKVGVQEALKRTIMKLREVNSEISLDWLHSRDGLERDGMRIEKPCKQNDRFPLFPSRTFKLQKTVLGRKTPEKLECYATESAYIKRNSIVYVDLEALDLYIKGIRLPIYSLGVLALGLALLRGGKVSYHEVLRDYQTYIRTKTSWTERRPEYSRYAFDTQFSKPINKEVRRYDKSFRVTTFGSAGELYIDDEFAREGIENYAIRVESGGMEAYLSGHVPSARFED